MHRNVLLLIILLVAFVLGDSPPQVSRAQQMSDNIVSEHVRLRMPPERQWLGTDTISELERCWKFVNGATGEKLPRRVLISLPWNEELTRVDSEQSTIVIGMNHPAAVVDPRRFLIRIATRELSRLGLLELSGGAAQREANEFLIEGMSQLLSLEWERNTKSITGAWVICYFLDKMHLLGFEVQTAWSKFFDGRHTLRSAAPGATFLTSCREIYGRERTAKLFEALRKNSLENALVSAFKAPSAALESAWLQEVRAHKIAEDFTATTEDEAPVLQQTSFTPADSSAGHNLQIRLFLRDSAGNLLPEGVFLEEEASGRVFQAKAAAEKNARYLAVEVPIEVGRQPGKYNYRVIAVDEAGNVRHWTAAYSVAD
jgi:hypothetical protein